MKSFELSFSPAMDSAPEPLRLILNSNSNSNSNQIPELCVDFPRLPTLDYEDNQNEGEKNDAGFQVNDFLYLSAFASHHKSQFDLLFEKRFQEALDPSNDLFSEFWERQKEGDAIDSWLVPLLRAPIPSHLLPFVFPPSFPLSSDNSVDSARTITTNTLASAPYCFHEISEQDPLVPSRGALAVKRKRDNSLEKTQGEEREKEEQPNTKKARNNSQETFSSLLQEESSDAAKKDSCDTLSNPQAVVFSSIQPRRRKGGKFRPWQLAILQQWIEEHEDSLNPNAEEKQKLARQIEDEYKSVAYWFARQRRVLKQARHGPSLLTRSATTNTDDGDNPNGNATDKINENMKSKHYDGNDNTNNDNEQEITLNLFDLY